MLRAENEALKQQLESGKGTRKERHFWRGFLVWLLIVLACIFTLCGALSAWVRTTTLDTNTFVNTIAPLVKQEAVAKAASDIAVTKLFEAYDVSGKIKTGLTQLDTAIQANLPPNLPAPDIKLSFIADPISNGLESFAKTASKKILQSDQFYKVWQGLLRTAHTSMVNIIRGNKSGVVSSSGDTVVLNLSPLLTKVKQQLVDAGLGFLDKVEVPKDLGQVKLFTAQKLGAVKQMVHLLDLLYWVFPLLALIFFVLAVVAARDRRKALLRAGIGLAVTMLLVLIVLKVTHSALLGQIKNPEILGAADAVWGIVLHGLKQAMFGLFALSFVVAVGAAVAGPYKWATWLRKHVVDFFKNYRERRHAEGAEIGPFYAFVDKYAWWLRGVGFAVAIIVLVALPNISALAIILTVIILAIYLAIVELLR